MSQNFGASFQFDTFGDPVKKRFVNRTGATLLKGTGAMIDFSDTQAEVTTIEAGSDAGVPGSLTPVTDAAAELGYPVVIADENIPDNGYGYCVIEGYVDIALLNNDVSTTDLAKGGVVGFVEAQAGPVSSGTTPVALTTGGARFQGLAAIGNRGYGLAAEASVATHATNSDRNLDAGSKLRRVYWYGGRFGERKRA